MSMEIDVEADARGKLLNRALDAEARVRVLEGMLRRARTYVAHWPIFTAEIDAALPAPQGHSVEGAKEERIAQAQAIAESVVNFVVMRISTRVPQTAIKAELANLIEVGDFYAPAPPAEAPAETPDLRCRSLYKEHRCIRWTGHSEDYEHAVLLGPRWNTEDQTGVYSDEPIAPRRKPQPTPETAKVRTNLGNCVLIEHGMIHAQREDCLGWVAAAHASPEGAGR